MFTLKPDYAQARERIEAFWNCDVLGRPVVNMFILRPAAELVPLPPSHHLDSASRWTDAQYNAEDALASLSNQEFLEVPL